MCREKEEGIDNRTIIVVGMLMFNGTIKLFKEEKKEEEKPIIDAEQQNPTA